MAIDLNRLRDVVRQNQDSGTARPDDPSRQVVVDREGNVRFGNQVSATEPVTQIPQETFAAYRTLIK
jgi:hypothetical protein